MKRRKFLKNSASGTLVSASTLAGLSSFSIFDNQKDNALEIFNNSIIIDGLTFGQSWDEEEFQALKKTGLSGFHASLLNRGSLESSMRSISDWHNRIKKRPDLFIHATKSEHFLQAKKEGKTAVLFGFQDTINLEGRLENLDSLYHMGTRCLQLSYNYRNLVGNGVLERVDGGLSSFGIRVVEKMNELGMIIDLSHCGAQTSADAIQFSKKPVAYTHTMINSVYEHVRAKTDDQIKAISDQGGITGIAGLGYFIGTDPGGETGIDDFVRHVDQAVKVGGIDHIALGMDFPVKGIQPWATKENWYEPRTRSFNESYKLRWPPWIPEIDVPERYLNIISALLKKGYKTHEIEKIMGQNWMWYYKEILG